MKMRTSGYVAALMIGATAFAGPAAAQFKGVGGGGAPHIGGGGGMGAHPSFGGGGMAAHPSFGGAGIAAHQNFGGAGFAARNTGAAPLITGRSVAAPNAGFAAAGAGPRAGFTGRPGFTGANPAFRGAWRGGHHNRFWPYAAAAAGAGLAYGAYGYDYDYPYDTGYYDSGYDAVPVAPAAVDADEGGSCATPVLVCRLYEPAPIGYGCSCTVNGGQARGVVQP
jgi:hypothetical protein